MYNGFYLTFAVKDCLLFFKKNVFVKYLAVFYSAKLMNNYQSFFLIVAVPNAFTFLNRPLTLFFL